VRAARSRQKNNEEIKGLFNVALQNQRAKDMLVAAQKVKEITVPK